MKDKKLRYDVEFQDKWNKYRLDLLNDRILKLEENEKLLLKFLNIEKKL